MNDLIANFDPQEIALNKPNPNPWWLLGESNLNGSILLDESVGFDVISVMSGLFNEVCLFAEGSSDSSLADIPNVVKVYHHIDEIDEDSFDLVMAHIKKGNFFEREVVGDCLLKLLKDNGAMLLIQDNGLFQKLYRRKDLKKIFKAKIGIETYPAILENGRLDDIFIGKLIPFVNDGTLKNRVKKYLFNKKMIRYLFLKEIWILKKNKPPEMFLDLIAHLGIQGLETKGLSPKRIMFWGMKLMIFFYYDNTEKGIVGMLSMDKSVIKKRGNEYQVLNHVNSINGLKQFIPFSFAPLEGSYGTCYFLEYIPGLIFDRIDKEHNQLTRLAIEFCLNLGLSTRNHDSLSFQKYRDMVDYLVNNYNLRNPGNEGLIDEIKKILLTGIGESEVCLSCMHGDYKIENIVFEKNKASIVKVIDWELSKIEGFPLLDLLHLFSYNNYLSSGEGVNEFYLSNYLDGKSGEKINKYCSAMGIGERYKNRLIVIYFLHHYACRVYYKKMDSEKNNAITQCLIKAKNLMQG